MKTLVVFYSRTGNTRKVAEKISRILKADLDEVTDLKDRKRFIVGWFISGMDASKNKLTEIKYNKSPAKYDLVIIGTPIWAWTVTPAIRSYLKQNKIKKTAFFCTCGGKESKAFKEMEKLSRKPIATLAVKDRELDSSDDKIKDFCRRLK